MPTWRYAIGKARAVAHQAAGGGVAAFTVTRGHGVARSQGQKLVALAGEERIGGHNQRIAPLAHQRLEGCVDLALGTGIEKNELATGVRAALCASVNCARDSGPFAFTGLPMGFAWGSNSCRSPSRFAVTS